MNERLLKMQTHPNFEKLHEDIWVIHNFISKEESQFYLDIAASAPEEDWWKREAGWWNGKFLFIKDSTIPSQIVNNIKDWIEDPDFWSWGLPSSVHRISPGEKMFLHADNPNEKSGLNNWVDLSFVLYHNDFNGGEIIYPQLNFEYHPMAGDLLMHPGSQNYIHGTNEVLPGPIRYNSTMWAYDNRVKKLHEENKIYEGKDIKNPAYLIENDLKANTKYSIKQISEDL
jgi:hypothetical protein